LRIAFFFPECATATAISAVGYLCRLPAAKENVACLANWALIASNTPWFMASF
jgi:hypothetical protein